MSQNPKTIGRRELLHGEAVAALAVAGAAVVPFAAKAETANEDEIRKLWERYTDLECESTRRSIWQDHITHITHDAYEALQTPWTPFCNKTFKSESNNNDPEIDAAIKAGKPHELIMRRSLPVVVEQVIATNYEPGGIPGEQMTFWQVKEFKPKPIRFEDDTPGRDWHPPAPNGVDSSYRPVRWTAYPDATTGEEAYAMSVARAKGEWGGVCPYAQGPRSQEWRGQG